ncbi:MAG TPA: DegT/DnrJ/EryC1/StrS family aminotransferase, partial [Microcoleaceae cyanobacterium]
IGSSYLPSELVAAFLWAQFQQAEQITEQRLKLWQRYHKAFAELELCQVVRRPRVPLHCQHNGHIYHLLLNKLETRTQVLAYLKAQGIQATFHYVPLHSSPAGQKYGRVAGDMSVTENLSDRILRLPLSTNLTVADIDQIITCVLAGLSDQKPLSSKSMAARA